MNSNGSRDLFPASAMTEGEARECIEDIKRSVESIRVRVLELYERRGWQALGYGSWRECVVAEFGQSERYLYRQLQAALIECEIWPNGQIGQIPEGQLRPLASIPEGKRREVWEAALATAPDGKMTARHVEATADAMIPAPAPLPNQPDLWSNDDDEQAAVEAGPEEDEPAEGEADDESEEEEEDVDESGSEGQDFDDIDPDSIERPVYPPGTLFQCEQCRDVFEEQVWHCPKCDHHWLTCESECKNCRSAGMYYEYNAGTALAQAKPDLTYEDIPRIAAERRAEAWVDLLNRFAMMTNAIQRQGGIAELAATWSPNLIPRAIVFLEKARDTFDDYASTLKEIISEQ